MHRAQSEEERRRISQKLKDEFFLPPLLEHRYRLEEVIGEGSYGVVCSAVNLETNERVAVKRIMRVFEEAPEAMRTLRELKFLRLLKDHENIITIKDVLLPSDRDHFDDVFVVLELLPTDLTRVLRSTIELSPDHIRCLVFQLTKGIFFMHTSRVFHRDLKPSNILINAKCDLRIVDFGLSRAAFDNQDPDFVFWTDYVATRWYRAPELIMAASSNYSTAIDMWSIGCIFAEMLSNGRPMFPGDNPEDQLQLIISFCGSPTHAAIQSVRDARARSLLLTMPHKERQPIEKLFPHVDPVALDLLSKILEFDPNKRMSAEDALKHPYFLQYESDTVIPGTPIDFEEFAFERQNLSMSELRTLFLHEITKYHPDKRDLYLTPADTPALRYTPQDQASRFRDAMVATQNGMEPPRAWDSMPNQRLTHYYEQSGVAVTNSTQADNPNDMNDMTSNGQPPSYPRTHSQAGSVSVVQHSEDDGNGPSLTTSTSGEHHYVTENGTDENMMNDTRRSGVTVRTSGLPGDKEVGDMDGGMGNGANDERLLMKYTGKLSSVESASSAMNFRHDSGPTVGKRVSETLESMIDPSGQPLPEGSGNEANDAVDRMRQ